MGEEFLKHPSFGTLVGTLGTVAKNIIEGNILLVCRSIRVCRSVKSTQKRITAKQVNELENCGKNIKK